MSEIATFLQDRNGIAFEPNKIEPFTGTYIRRFSDVKTPVLFRDEEHVRWFEDGYKQLESNYKDGKKHGLTTAWFENGQKEIEVNFKNGKMEGVFIRWFKVSQSFFAQPEITCNFKDGKLNGLMETYFESGGQKEYANYKNDQLDGWMEIH